MTENVEVLLEELRRRNAEKRRQALLKDLAGADGTDGAGSVIGDNKGSTGKETVKVVVARGHNDLHEVASRIKGKK